MDVHAFVNSCQHCLATTVGVRVPRPFCSAVHGSPHNYLLQFDYLELGFGSTGQKYVLFLSDDHSGDFWLFPFANANAENAAHSIVDWFATFDVSSGLISDGRTPFRNKNFHLAAKAIPTPHHFTIPYCPWSYGVVERPRRKELCVARPFFWN